ncbi:MAG: hypothetical protein IKP61_02960 [Spirochaetales bacterium]|nr:hypothetical protein [Spirochaetales bacterium]
MADKNFYFAKDIEEMLDVKETKAYQVIVTLNQELEEKGFMTFKGRVLASCFRQRVGLSN